MGRIRRDLGLRLCQPRLFNRNESRMEDRLDLDRRERCQSFTNINVNSGLNKQLSGNLQYAYYMDGSQSTAPGSAVNEIMVWLANFNAGPISAQFNSAGQPVPIVSNLSLAGHTWNLYFGSNGANTSTPSSRQAALSQALAQTSTYSSRRDRGHFGLGYAYDGSDFHG
ncbi:hypothetical protein FB451DRAFT_1168553 [Mycena latifolia]|nr:hypothetical protein FB451DRAFT_1168553 [Mycena latifolia]